MLLIHPLKTYKQTHIYSNLPCPHARGSHMQGGTVMATPQQLSPILAGHPRGFPCLLKISFRCLALCMCLKLAFKKCGVSD